MIDEWPIIEKRIRSYQMVFRKKKITQEIVVVGAGEADEIEFDPESSRKKRTPAGDKIRISEEEKLIYDLVDGQRTVGDVVEVSRFAEFDTNKALYELLTRDLIEEVRGQTAPAIVEQAPVDETEVAETPVPLPLVIVLAAIALFSLATSFRNPLNHLGAIGRPNSAVSDARKAISLQRVETIARAIDRYSIVNGHLPDRLQDLAPYYLSPELLSDPWGNAYKYLPRPDRYLVIGFSPDGKVDTDLMLSRGLDASGSNPSPATTTGGKIELID